MAETKQAQVDTTRPQRARLPDPQNRKMHHRSSGTCKNRCCGRCGATEGIVKLIEESIPENRTSSQPD